MKLHDLRPDAGSTKRKSRVGRGIAAGQGKTAGRGTKGQGARAGGGKGKYFEGGQLPLVRRLPFKRGFSNLFRIHYQPVNVEQLEAAFDKGADVNPATLAAAGLLREASQPVVILGEGDLKKKLTVKTHRCSGSAREKIEAAGGSVEILALEQSGPHATIKKLRKEQIEALKAKADAS